jgi:hypothetical protein
MSVQSDFGYVIEKGDTFVIRSKIRKDGSVQVVCHKIVDGEEIVPKIHIDGVNIFTMPHAVRS